MALVPIISQTWDTTSVFNPTRMNTIENNIAIAATAEGTKYSNGVSVKDVLDLSTLTSKSTITGSTTTATLDISDFTWDMFNPLLAIMTTRVANNTTANLCIFINVSGTLAYKNIGDANITGISLSGNTLTVTMPTYANIVIIGNRKTV